jgi:hypothetical protein
MAVLSSEMASCGEGSGGKSVPIYVEGMKVEIRTLYIHLSNPFSGIYIHSVNLCDTPKVEDSPRLA